MNTNLLHYLCSVFDDHFSVVFEAGGGDKIHCIENRGVKAE